MSTKNSSPLDPVSIVGKQRFNQPPILVSVSHSENERDSGIQNKVGSVLHGLYETKDTGFHTLLRDQSEPSRLGAYGSCRGHSRSQVHTVRTPTTTPSTSTFDPNRRTPGPVEDTIRDSEREVETRRRSSGPTRPESLSPEGARVGKGTSREKKGTGGVSDDP